MKRKNKPLRALIYGQYDSEAALAKEIGWSRQKLNKITNGQKEPTVEELNKLALALTVQIGELAEIFLQNKSPNGDVKTNVS